MEFRRQLTENGALCVYKTQATFATHGHSSNTQAENSELRFSATLSLDVVEAALADAGPNRGESKCLARTMFQFGSKINKGLLTSARPLNPLCFELFGGLLLFGGNGFHTLSRFYPKVGKHTQRSCMRSVRFCCIASAVLFIHEKKFSNVRAA